MKEKKDEYMNMEAYSGFDDFQYDLKANTLATVVDETKETEPNEKLNDDVNIWKFGPKNVKALIGDRPESMPVCDYEKIVSDIVDIHQEAVGAKYLNKNTNESSEMYSYVTYNPPTQLKDVDAIDLLNNEKKAVVKIPLKRMLAPFQAIVGKEDHKDHNSRYQDHKKSRYMKDGKGNKVKMKDGKGRYKNAKINKQEKDVMK